MASQIFSISPQQSIYTVGQVVTLMCKEPANSEYPDYVNVNVIFGYSINGATIVWNSEKRNQGRLTANVIVTDTITLPNIDSDSTVTFYSVAARIYGSDEYPSTWKTLSTANAVVVYSGTLQAPNTAPTISGMDSLLGDKYASFSQSYTVNDINTTDVLTVTTKIDSTQISSFAATRNTNYAVDLASYFNSLALGVHTITVSVSDGKAAVVRTYTFNKVNPPNIAPTIIGNDEDLGQRADSFTIDYSINDANAGDTLNVTEKIDTTTIKTFTATRNTNYTLDLSNNWDGLILGEHTITIIVSDGALTATRTYTFVKSSTANHIPIISGSNGDLGEKKKTFSLDFTVNDLDVADTLDVTIKLDNTINKLIPNAIRNTTYTYSLEAENFQALTNTEHTISINVTDGKANSTRIYKFTKSGQIASSDDLDIYEYPSKKLDLKKDKDIYIQCKQLDDIILNFEIYNNSIPINIEQFFIEIRGGNSSNLVITSDGITKNNNKVKIECLRALTSISGEIPIELRFSNASGKQKRTFNIILDVKPSILDDVSNTIIITTLEHLDNSLEAARIINESFNNNIVNAKEISNNIKVSTTTATNTKNDLDLSNTNATSTKKDLDVSTTNANNSKKALDAANVLAATNTNNLDVANVQAVKNYDALNQLGDATNLAKKVQDNTAQLSQSVQEINTVKTDYAKKADVNLLASNKAENTTVQALQTQVNSVASGSPKNVFATLALLQADTTANTTEGKKYIYVVTADGKWYYWNGSAWTVGGTYQSTGLANASVTSAIVDGVVGANIFPFHKNATFNGWDYTWKQQLTDTIKNIELYNTNIEKIYLSPINNSGVSGFIWVDWSKFTTGIYINFTSYSETGIDIKSYLKAKPTSKWTNKKWTVVGDSITEKNFRTAKNYHDYIASEIGCIVSNQGKSGTGYLADAGSNVAICKRIDDAPNDSDLVTIFAGVNDYSSNQPLGTIDDVFVIGGTNNTFYATVDWVIRAFVNKFPTKIIACITPMENAGTWGEMWESPNAGGNKLRDYADVVMRICKRRGIPCLDLTSQNDLYVWNQPSNVLYFKQDGIGADANAYQDGLHPNSLGHKIIADKILSFINSL